MNIVMVVMW